MVTEVDNTNTNIFTNIWPQHPKHNQRMLSKSQSTHNSFIILLTGAWFGWEDYARNLAKEMGDILVITGANAQPGGTK